ncbi:hypothetical protein KAU51_02655 [Candidatus Parcubacteria bacterium]|nr:hypothetical protein [Candidatus Parcubacteria bacterium]
MEKKDKIKSKGQISREFLILGGIIIGIIVLSVVMLKILWKPNPVIEEEKIEPIYEVVVGDVRFKIGKVEHRGNILEASEVVDYQHQRKDITTTEKFIEVTITAENIGKDNIPGKSWDIQEIVDSEGRKFYSFDGAEYWISDDSRCGALLKPGFTPTLCTKIYEVAKISTGLKLKIYSKDYKEGDYFIDLGM